MMFSAPTLARADQAEGIAALSTISALATAVCWTTALGEEGDEGGEPGEAQYARQGMLVGAALAYAVETVDSDRESRGTHLSLNNSFGIKGRAGYRCHRYASAEVQVEWIHSFEGTVFADGAGRISDFDIQPLVVTANARGYVPVWRDRVQPFAIFGGGLASIKTKARSTTGSRTRSNNRATEFALRVGAGIDYYATPNVVVTLESDWVRPFGTLDDFDYMSIGLGVQYRF